MYAVLTVMYKIVDIAPDLGRLISNLESSPCMDYHREIVNFNAYCMDLCTLPIVKPVWMSTMAMLEWINFSRTDETLWSREVSGIAVASYSLLNSNLCAVTVYTWRTLQYMILGIIDTATTMFYSSITGRTVTSAEIDGMARYA